MKPVSSGAASPLGASAQSGRPALDETDEDLFKKVQAGRRDAFAILVERYQRRGYAVAVRLLGRSPDAEDAVQQAFLRLYERRADYDSRWRLSTWFYRILTNACVDELRRRRPMLPLPESDAAAPDAPDKDLEAAERDRLLRRALAEVPVEARIALTLYYGDGRTYREIATIRGVSANTVKTHLRRGRLALRRSLRAHGVAGI